LKVNCFLKPVITVKCMMWFFFGIIIKSATMLLVFLLPCLTLSLNHGYFDISKQKCLNFYQNFQFQKFVFCTFWSGFENSCSTNFAIFCYLNFEKIFIFELKSKMCFFSWFFDVQTGHLFNNIQNNFFLILSFFYLICAVI
jgi:hypothetical protein